MNPLNSFTPNYPVLNQNETNDSTDISIAPLQLDISYEELLKEIEELNNKNPSESNEVIEDPSNPNSYYWSKEEDEILLDAVKRNITYKDISIILLEGKRSETACYLRYSNHLAPEVDNSPLKEDEKRILKNFIDSNPGKKSFNRLLLGRTHLFIKHALISIIRSNTPKSHERLLWTDEEDEKLVLAVEKHGSDWKAIAEEVGSRNAEQCKNRYQKHLDPSLNKEPFSTEEQKIIFQGFLSGKTNTEISWGLTNRNAPMIRLFLKSANGKKALEEYKTLENIRRNPQAQQIPIPPLPASASTEEMVLSFKKKKGRTVDLWSKDEDLKLEAALNEAKSANQKPDFDVISLTVFEGKRTGRSCHLRYLNHFKDGVDDSEIREDEIKILKDYLSNPERKKTHGSLLENRSAEFITVQLKSLVRKDKKISHMWDEDEDKKLLEGIEKCGKDWKKIAEEYVKTRTAVQCSSRFKFCFDPKYNYADLTRDEEQIVVENHLNGETSAAIAKKLTKRTTHTVEAYIKSMYGKKQIEEFQKTGELSTSIEKPKKKFRLSNEVTEKANQLKEIIINQQKPPQPVVELQESSSDEEVAKAKSKTRKRWTSDEDKILKNAVEEEKLPYKDIVEKYFKDTRNVMALMQRYNARFANGVDNSPLKETERSILVSFIENPEGKSKITLLPGRNAKFIHAALATVQNSLSTTLNVRWSDQEDEKLLNAVEKHGENWSLVSGELKDRTPSQCNHRYRTTFDPDIVHDSFSYEEELVIVKMHLEGKSKADIANALKNRSSLTIRGYVLSNYGKKRLSEYQNTHTLSANEEHQTKKRKATTELQVKSKKLKSNPVQTTTTTTTTTATSSNSVSPELQAEMVKSVKKRGKNWSKEDDAILKKAVEVDKISDFGVIAEKYFSNNRTKNSCYERYNRHLAQGIDKSELTDDEKKILEDYAAKNDKNIGLDKLLPGRSSHFTTSALRKIRNASDTYFKHWSKEEDDKLINLAKEKNEKWEEIAKQFSNRSALQCKNRHTYINPDINKDPYTKEELETIYKMHLEAKAFHLIATALGNKRDAISVQRHLKSVQGQNDFEAYKNKVNAKV